MGHPPKPFETPHFDFHFYTISDSARRAIDCTDKLKPAALPAGYTMEDMTIPGIGLLVGTCVPRMGMHAGNYSHGPVPFHAMMVLIPRSLPRRTTPRRTRTPLPSRDSNRDVAHSIAGIISRR